jgi:hypothetical protein
MASPEMVAGPPVKVPDMVPPGELETLAMPSSVPPTSNCPLLVMPLTPIVVPGSMQFQTAIPPIPMRLVNDTVVGENGVFLALTFVPSGVVDV